MSNWGIGADLGYFTSSVATITDSTTGKPFLKVDGSNMSVDTAGPTLGVFVTYHLNELLH